MSESDRSRSESPASDHQSDRKSRNSHDSGSNRSSYSEKFYSDDGFTAKNESKRKTQNGIWLLIGTICNVICDYSWRFLLIFLMLIIF